MTITTTYADYEIKCWNQKDRGLCENFSTYIFHQSVEREVTESDILQKYRINNLSSI